MSGGHLGVVGFGFLEAPEIDRDLNQTDDGFAEMGLVLAVGNNLIQFGFGRNEIFIKIIRVAAKPEQIVIFRPLLNSRVIEQVRKMTAECT